MGCARAAGRSFADRRARVRIDRRDQRPRACGLAHVFIGSATPMKW
jgi:hypothetical protein